MALLKFAGTSQLSPSFATRGVQTAPRLINTRPISKGFPWELLLKVLVSLCTSEILKAKEVDRTAALRDTEAVLPQHHFPEIAREVNRVFVLQAFENATIYWLISDI